MKDAKGKLLACLIWLMANAAFILLCLPYDLANGEPRLASMIQLDRRQQCSVLDFAGVSSCGSDTDVVVEPHRSEMLSVASRPEEDPMLAKMPGIDFMAYRRADISTIYGEAPGSRQEKVPAFQGQAGKFVNMSPERLDFYWEDDEDDESVGNYMAATGPFESSGTATFPGHVFYFARPSTQEIVCTFTVQPNVSVYYCDPFVVYDPSDPSAGEYEGQLLDLDSLRSDQRELYDSALFNREFAPLYKNFTGGSEWLGHFPTKPPRHPMWRADYLSQEHHIQTRETHFKALPPQEYLHRLRQRDMRRNESDAPALMEYREPGTMNITITAVSVAPRIFQINGFLSEIEVDQ
jgi:hypothetical protein